ncbi:MAG: 8-oxoguanine deaminase [Spirochaetales bacterium]|nr:8-oxoguanine deaminase [Spirochaetales bacterium]
MTKPLLLKDCMAVYSDGKTLRNYDILINDTVIEKLEKNIQLTRKEAVVFDCSTCVVLPGFVNTHHHFYQVLTRNLPQAQNSKLFPWLVYHYDVWKHLTAEGIYHSTLAAIGELLKTGCTCTTDHHYLYPKGVSEDIPSIQFEAASRCGMRFSPTRGSMSLSKKDGGLPPDSVVQEEERILQESAGIIDRYHDSSPTAMRKVILAPCSPFSVTNELMRETARLARKKKVRLHTHLAETEDETNFCIKRYGKRPLALMEETEFIGNDVSYAHGIHFTDEELDLLAQTGTAVCHCPSSNMRLGSGIARVREMLDRGITVGVAVDGSASNDASDMLGELRQTLLLQRVRYGADALGVREVIKMGTENGAAMFGFGNIGKILPGWTADMAVFDMNRIDYAGSLSDPVAALLFSGACHMTRETIVNGKIVVEEGRLLGYDEEDIAARVNDLAAEMLLKSAQG